MAVHNGKWMKGIKPRERLSNVAERMLNARLAPVRHYLPLAADQATRDVEYVHQLRVASRRAVATIEMYQDVLPKKLAKELRKSLKQIRSAAGLARDYDVLLDRHVCREGCEGAPGDDALVAIIRQRRSQAQQPIVAVHDQVKSDAFMANVAARLSLGVKQRLDRRKHKDPRFSNWARARLWPIVKRFFRAEPDDLSDLEALHRFRIRGKRLRYAMELLVSAFPPEFRTRLYSDVERLQERLGEINDHASALERFGRWLQETEEGEARQRLEALVRDEQVALEESLAEFQDWWTPKRRRRMKRRFKKLLKK